MREDAEEFAHENREEDVGALDVAVDDAVLAVQVDTNIARLFNHRIRHVQEVDGPEHNNDY